MWGTPLQPSNFRQRVWDQALPPCRTRRGGYRFHDLRHTVAGHANPLITLKRYSHLLDARVTEDAECFDPARV